MPPLGQNPAGAINLFESFRPKFFLVGDEKCCSINYLFMNNRNPIGTVRMCGYVI